MGIRVFDGGGIYMIFLLSVVVGNFCLIVDRRDFDKDVWGIWDRETRDRFRG